MSAFNDYVARLSALHPEMAEAQQKVDMNNAASGVLANMAQQTGQQMQQIPGAPGGNVAGPPSQGNLAQLAALRQTQGTQQLGAANPVQFGATPLQNAASLLDNQIKQTQVQTSQTQNMKDQIWQDPIHGDVYQMNPQNNSITPLIKNPYGPPPTSDQGKVAFDAKRGVFGAITGMAPQGQSAGQAPPAQPQQQGYNPQSFEPPGVPLSKDQVSAENELRGKANEDPNIKEFGTVQSYYAGMKAVAARQAQNPTNAGDYALLTNFQRINDPGGMVRSQQFNDMQDVPGWTDKMLGAGKKVMNGGMLDNNERADFLNIGDALYKGKLAGANTAVDRYQDIAKKSYFANPARVISHFSDLSQSAPGAAPTKFVSSGYAQAYAQKNNLTPQQALQNLQQKGYGVK